MRKNLIAIACGILGVLLTLTAWHVYEDHLLVDALRVNLQQQAQQAMAKPK